MAKTSRLEDLLEQLEHLRAGPALDAAAIGWLRHALDHKSSHLIAKTAQLIAAREVTELGPALAAAFERLLDGSIEADRGCRAKTDLAAALYHLGEDRLDLFRRGIRYFQREPMFGGREDTAVALRAHCALALVRLRAPDVMVALAELLADPEPRARAGAARAIGLAADPAGIPLLRLKALHGDCDPDVLSECFTALLALDAKASLPFVARFLDARETEIAELAALALGQSREHAAFDALRSWWERSARSSGELRSTALIAIASLRFEDALAFVVALIAGGTTAEAIDAAEALAPYHEDHALHERVLAAAAARDSRSRDTILRAFAPGGK